MILMCTILLWCGCIHSYAAPSVSAHAYVLYCVNSGKTIDSQNADTPLPMASTTKVMTALLALEYAAKDNRVVTFSNEMIAEGSSMYLQVGEQLTLRDLAVGMLLCSGNDAANAAAITIGGSIEGFARMMNRRAKELGLQHTHFVTPSGLDDEQHYSTAYDMARLTAAAMENQAFAEIAGSQTARVDFISPPDKSVTYRNHNRLLSMIDGCIGGKTGYTDRAGRCLVSCVERDGVRLVCVTLDDPDDWDDHMALFDEGFRRLHALDDRSTYQVAVAGGDRDTLALYVDRAYPPVMEGDPDSVRRRVLLPAFAYAPIKRADDIGMIIYEDDNGEIDRVILRAEKDISAVSEKRSLIDIIKEKLHWLNR